MTFKHYKQIKTQELPSMNIKKNINNQNKLWLLCAYHISCKKIRKYVTNFSRTHNRTLFNYKEIDLWVMNIKWLKKIN